MTARLRHKRPTSMADYMRSTVYSISKSIKSSLNCGMLVKWIESTFRGSPSLRPFLKFWKRYSEMKGVMGAINCVALIRTSNKMVSAVL